MTASLPPQTHIRPPFLQRSNCFPSRAPSGKVELVHFANFLFALSSANRKHTHTHTTDLVSNQIGGGGIAGHFRSCHHLSIQFLLDLSRRVSMRSALLGTTSAVSLHNGYHLSLTVLFSVDQNRSSAVVECPASPPSLPVTLG